VNVLRPVCSHDVTDPLTLRLRALLSPVSDSVALPVVSCHLRHFTTYSLSALPCPALLHTTLRMLHRERVQCPCGFSILQRTRFVPHTPALHCTDIYYFYCIFTTHIRLHILHTKCLKYVPYLRLLRCMKCTIVDPSERQQLCQLLSQAEE
jgi:hypothetical protein